MRLFFVFLLTFVLAACEGSFGSDSDTPASYSAHTKVATFDIAVRIVDAHPFLNEHRINVGIRRGMTLVTSFAMVDPGGFSRTYVLDDGPRLFVINGLLDGKVIDKTSGTVTDVRSVDVPSRFDEVGVGSFEFTDEPIRYVWMPVKAPDGTATGHKLGTTVPVSQ